MIVPMPTATPLASAADLAGALELFLAEHPFAAVLEEGRVLFDMQSARYSLSTEHGRCLLHVWSEERNIVRTIVAVEARKGALRLHARRLGQARPQTLTVVADRDQRTHSTRTTTRTRYLHTLERVLERTFFDHTVQGMRTAMDLEHSFGPAYARGMLLRGTNASAVVGVNAEETQATVDGVLTIGILWLAYCREHGDGRRLFQGLRIIVPSAAAAITRQRMAWMNPQIAKWELYTLDERGEEFLPVDLDDSGNLDVHMTHAFDPHAALSRTRSAVERLMSLLPHEARQRVEIQPRSSTEIGLLLHGLEFARVRHGVAANSFAREDEITFGAGANETTLTDDSAPLFMELAARLFESRNVGGSHRNPLYRLQPERWLESVLRGDLAEIVPHIRREFVYTQVPAFSSSDRGMLDMLTVTHSGRLAVIELKASEDLQLPFQGLDYWMRVRRLQVDGAAQFQRHGYFPGVELSSEPPLLYFIAPALRIHPANEVVLRHISRDVEWTFIALGEAWREQRTVVFRKRAEIRVD
jgi:hypothetical protein